MSQNRRPTRARRAAPAILVLVFFEAFFHLCLRPPTGAAQTPQPLFPPDARSTSSPVAPPVFLDKQATLASTAAVTITGVPAYLWRHGCGPTAAGMVLGYWDIKGYASLFPGSAASQTPQVNVAIASDGTSSHWTDYCLPMDSASAIVADCSQTACNPLHADDCLADYMRASRSASGNCYGWAMLSDVAPALQTFMSAASADYQSTTETLYMGSNLTWDRYCQEIDNGRPMVLLVDANADGATDHFVTAVGHDVTSLNVQRYGSYNTYSTSVTWYDFRSMASGRMMGIYAGVSFCPKPAKSSLLSPPHSAFTYDSSPVFYWTPSTGATMYDLQIDDMAKFSSPLVNISGLAQAHYEPTYLPPDTYYWHVRGRSACDVSFWSTTYRVTVMYNFAPAVGSVTPSTGTFPVDAWQTFTTIWSDQNGWNNLKWCFFAIGTTPSLAHSVYLCYNNLHHTLMIRSNDGTAWWGGRMPGTNFVIQNNQAMVDCLHTTVNKDGDVITVTWAVKFKPGYTGTKKLYLRAVDTVGLDTGAVLKGTILVQ